MNESNATNYRIANRSDIPEICRIYNSHIDLGGSTFETEYWQEETLSQEIVDNPNNIWFVAENRDGIIGWSSARLFSPRFGYRLTREIAIYFWSAHTGKGHSRGLLQKTEDVCAEQGIHHLVSRVIAGNQRSLQFHFRCGYEMVGIQKEIGRLNGEWLDVAILQKILTDKQ